MRRQFVLASLVLLVGCGPVAWQCSYEDATTGDLVVWSDGEMACKAARSSGYQVLASEEDDCSTATDSVDGCICVIVDRAGCGGRWND